MPDVARRRRLVPLGTVVVAASALGACGGDGESAFPLSTAATTGSTIDDRPIELPGIEAPFLIVDRSLIVTSRGEVYRRNEEPEGFVGSGYMAPTPVAPTGWEVAQLTDAGLDDMIAIADEHGFLDPPPDYALFVTDSNPFWISVTLASAGYEHEIYDPEDLDVGDDEADAARRRARDFVEAMANLPDRLGADLGPFEPYLPAAWFVHAQPHADDGGVADWPFTDGPVEGCTSFPGDEPTAEGVDGATGRYVHEDTVYDVIPRFPWESPC